MNIFLIMSSYTFDYNSDFSKVYLDSHLQELNEALNEVNIADLFLVEEDSPYYRQACNILGYAYLSKAIRIDVNHIDEAFDYFRKARNKFFMEYISLTPSLSKNRRQRMLKYYKRRFDRGDQSVYFLYGRCLINDGQSELGLEVLSKQDCQSN